MANEFKVKKGLIVEGSGGTILDIQGSQGQLFSISDSLIGDIFSVSDISGIPIFNINSDGTGTHDGTFTVSGDVGIGTTTPTKKLDISGSIKLTGNIYNNSSQQVFANTGGSWTPIAAKGINLGDWDTVASYGQVLVGNYDFNILKDNSSTILTVKNSTGNVGIGTTSPNFKLHVDGSALFDTNAGANPFYIARNSSTAESLKIYVDDAAAVFESIQDETGSYHGSFDFKMDGGSPNAYTYWRHGNTVQMALYQGSLGVGTTTPSTKLDVNGVITATGGNSTTWNSHTSNIGDITAVTAGNYLTGGGTSGSVTLDVDPSTFFRKISGASASVAAGWMTVASTHSSRKSGEVIVTDGDSADHAYIRISWMRSFQDSNFSVINCGGHANRITGVRVLSQDSDTTYGWKYLQVYVSASSTYYSTILKEGSTPAFGDLTVVTPVLQNTIPGYSLHGAQLTGLDTSSLASEEGITVGGNAFINGGNITLGSTGRIQGIDTVSASTDAVNKAYVDSAVSGGPFLPLAGGTMTGVIKTISGTASAPALQIGDPDSGLYDSGSNAIGFACQGAKVAEMLPAHSLFYNNVGIGTTSPNAKLDVSTSAVEIGTIIGNTTHNSQLQIYTAAASKNSELWFGDAADSDVGKIDYDHANNSMAITTNAVERMRINALGNVGIGTTSPLTSLEVKKDNAPSIITITGGLNTQTTLGNEIGSIDFKSNDASIISTNDIAGRIVSVSEYSNGAMAGMAFYTADNTVAPFIRERMRISNTGNVGIGTKSPSEKLTVKGDNAGISLRSNDYMISRIIPRGSNTSNLDKGLFSLYNASVESTRIDSAGNSWLNGGNVGIGTTSPTAKLDVNGEIAIRGGEGADDARMYFRASDNSNRFTIETDLDGTTANDLLGFRGASTDNILVLKGDGKVGIGTTSPGTKLEVDGVITIAPSSSNVAELKGLYGTSFLSMDFMLFDNKLFGNAIVQNQMMQTMVFNDGSGEGMRLSQGKLGIGSTTPNSKLTIEGTESGLFKIRNEAGEDYFALSQSASNKPTVTFGDVDEQYGTMFNLDVDSKEIDIFNNGIIKIGDNGFGNNTLFTVDDVNRKFTFENGAVGVGTTTPRAKLDVAGGIRMANETATATAANVGTMRYRVVNTRSYMDMCMQVGTSSYAWVNVAMNQW